MNTRMVPTNSLRTAVSLLQQGRLADAEAVCRQVLEARPEDFDTLHLLGMLNAQTGRAQQALDFLQKAIQQRTDVPSAHNNLGNVLRMLQRPGDALTQYSRAIELRPGFPEALLGRSGVLLELRRPAEALADINTVLERAPASHLLLLTRGLAQLELNDPSAAAASFESALALRADDARTHCALAAALLALNRSTEALASSERAIALNALDAGAHANRASALQLLGRPEEALTSADEAIRLDPRMAMAYHIRAAALASLMRADEALRSADAAISLRHDFAQAHVNRAAALIDLQRPVEALAAADYAIELDPSQAQAHINRGIALQALARTEEALASLQTATSLDPSSVSAHFNKALCHLQLGQFDVGWPLYEWRLRIRPAPDHPTAPARWTGTESLAGKTIVLHAEQGLGDTIQFCRFAPRIRQLGARVVLSVQPDLCGLLTSLDPAIEVTHREAHQIPADFQLPLASIPFALGLSQPDSLVSSEYLRPHTSAASTHTAARAASGFKVGINWQGSRNKIDIGRSIALRQFAPLAQIPGVRLISLQKGYGTEQLNDLPPSVSIETPVTGVGSEAMLDLAALIRSLDLVVTSDTLIAHLAGAMGVRTWVALKFSPDWRWQLDRNDSPWYPSLRLFRQSSPGDWDTVFDQIASALRTERMSGGRVASS
jgi:tetratricopeptide (TPR) repeat protein